MVDKKNKQRKLIGIGFILCLVPFITGCELIDMALTDAGIVKDGNGERRFVTEEERKEAEESGRLNVDYEVVESKIDQGNREVKIVIKGDVDKVTQNDIKLISELVWFETKEKADFSMLDILVYDSMDSVDGKNPLGTGIFVAKGKLSTEEYASLQHFDFHWIYDDKIYRE